MKSTAFFLEKPAMGSRSLLLISSNHRTSFWCAEFLMASIGLNGRSGLCVLASPYSWGVLVPTGFNYLYMLSLLILELIKTFNISEQVCFTTLLLIVWSSCLNWKCISDSEWTRVHGSVCIPPPRFLSVSCFDICIMCWFEIDNTARNRSILEHRSKPCRFLKHWSFDQAIYPAC